MDAPYQQLYNRNAPEATWSINPFRPNFAWEVDTQRGLFYVVHMDGYAISKYNQEEGSRVVLSKAQTPDKLTDAEARTWFEEARREIQLSGRNPDQSLYRRVRLPEYKHPIEDILVDSKGRLWLQLRPSHFQDEEHLYDIVSPSGGYLYHVKAPFPIDHVADTTLYRVSEDSLGVQVVEAYRFDL